MSALSHIGQNQRAYIGSNLETDKSDDKGGVGETLTDSKAAPGQLQEQHPNFLLPTPTVKATTSMIDQLPQRGSLTTNLSEVVERKKSIAAPRNGDEVVSETPSRSVSPNIASVAGNQSGAGIHIVLNEASPTDSNTNATNSNLSSKNSPKRRSSPKTNLPSPTNKVNRAVTNTCGNTESPQVSPLSCTTNLPTEIPTSTTKYVESPDFAKSNDYHIHSKERSWTEGPDMNLDQKNRNYKNIDSPGLVNSSTEKQQELSQTSNELSTNITVPLVVLEKCRKRRDPTRTLEDLNGKLQTEEKKEGQNAATKQMLDSIKNQENGNGSNMTNKSLLPTVFVTEPSKPSTPMIKTSAQAVEESTDGDWTEAEDEADYESDYEYSVSQTFSLKGALPIGDLYPLSRSSSRCSPFISDYDSDASMPLFMLPSREAESRGRVDRLFAFPAPSFTCSITYDGQESWDEESLHSCAEYDEEYYGRLTRSSRPGSSALGAYLSPAAFSSDEDFDGTHFHEEVDVGCTLRLVDKAAMRADNYEEDSEYYDEEEYSDEECWDENGEYHEDEACDNDEEYEDEEKEVSDMVDEMHSTEESPDEKSTDSRCPLAFSQPAEVEDDINFEEMNDEFEVDMTIELAVPQLVKRPLEYPETHREVTYTKDLQLLIEDGEAETLSIDQHKSAKAEFFRNRNPMYILLKALTVWNFLLSQVEMSRTPQCVVPVEETEVVDESTALPDEENRHDVTVVPTYVRPQAETIKEESASRFSNQKAATDFARKAVIQPPKLHTAAVQQVETKTAPEQQAPVPETRTKETPEPEMSATIAKGLMTKNNEDGFRLYVETPIMKVNEEGLQPKRTYFIMPYFFYAADISLWLKQVRRPIKFLLQNVEDKSGVRKSALNMSLEEAKHKAAVNEEAAKQKARRFGTVSSLLNRFKEPALKEEPITYKRSCYLEQQEVERPKKEYNIVKPAINDNFDKQMEEIRTQMKSGSSHFQNSVKDLSKGITSTAEDIKKRAEEEKKKIIMDSVSGVFSKADEENARWKEKREAETEKELAKIEAEKDRRKKVIVPQPRTEPEKPAEPKRIVRKITKDKSSTVQQTKANDGLVLITGKAAETSSKPAAASVTDASTEPKSSRAVAPVALIDQDVSNSFSAPPISMERPKLPKTENVVNEDNYDLFEAIGNFTNVRKTDSPTLKTATEKSPKRYATRRKTQEIVNESAEPKVRKRKQTYKRSKFIRDPHDIDVLLGWDKENTFEKMDQMFSRAAKDLINGLPPKKRKRVPASKIWISDLTDIDKIYSISEIRDIIASANA
ncbi:unnamed protein product [Angiostrongylus costaricensis]|uniref:DUF4585 domain-containing protein n=1 Tax=Angiostrongylus costaricensis TaxID=334426 RepID=A0A158PIH7_ANGCS|nr:unnamed protein product [Angiostrongylus costaricensis]